MLCYYPSLLLSTPSRAICLRTLEEGGGRASSKKDSKTVYDMIAYLSGRSMPGIPINPTLPTDPLERVKQVYWQHSTLLTFLRYVKESWRFVYKNRLSVSKQRQDEEIHFVCVHACIHVYVCVHAYV